MNDMEDVVHVSIKDLAHFQIKTMSITKAGLLDNPDRMIERAKTWVDEYLTQVATRLKEESNDRRR